MAAADDLFPKGDIGDELKKRVKAQAARQLLGQQENIDASVGMNSGSFFKRITGGG